MSDQELCEDNNKKLGRSVGSLVFYRIKLNPFKFFSQLGRFIKFSFQRIIRGWCDADVWNIDDWFLSIMPDMLQQLKETEFGYTQMFLDNGDLDPDSEEKWKDILDKMILLFRDSYEPTCSYKNKYEEDWQNTWDKFSEDYGKFGEKLEENDGPKRIHFPHEVDEHKEITKLFLEEEERIENYRNNCKNEAFELFSKWFWNLWD